MTMVGKILVIDDEADVGEFVTVAARGLGLDCIATTDAADALQLCAPDISLILLDLMMPGMDGIEVLRLLGEHKCTASIVLMSGINKRVMETAEKLAAALGLAIAGHLEKPFRLSELEEVLKRLAGVEGSRAVPANAEIPVSDEMLRTAIERNQFVLHYQPQIEISTGKIVGLEALVRINHPELGLIHPDNFISRLESLGLIDELGWIVADRGLAEIGQFADSDKVVPRLALNVSVNSLQDLKFPDMFLSLVKKHGVPPEGVIIEITESGLIDALSRTLDVLARLRMKGIQLSIDDFGTGYAMMRQLLNVPATELKIDRIFVMDMDMNNSDRIMVQKTIEIGHELGMKVIAEGVERISQLDFLRSRGCDSVQGYLYSRPLPPAELISWLAVYRAGLSQ
ncbi:MAG: EAL domain-containing response regulator [Terracidiphilus sp.]|jgi:EAL domain-containing protein (putative c-di-GMP-specific phosphodiesterase class I)